VYLVGVSTAAWSCIATTLVPTQAGPAAAKI